MERIWKGLKEKAGIETKIASITKSMEEEKVEGKASFLNWTNKPPNISVHEAVFQRKKMI